MMSEKISLLGKHIYNPAEVPGELTLKAFPTGTELDYVGAEDFDKNMLDNILPQCIEENFDFNKLLQIDFQWICRGLRFMNYGPYFTTNVIFCPNCGRVDGEYQVNLKAVGCKPLPADLTKNDITISADQFVDYDKEVHIHLLTVGEAMNMKTDSMFQTKKGTINVDYARVCYSISSMNGVPMNAVTAKMEIEEKFSQADYEIIKSVVADLTDFGLRAGGHCLCPKCHTKEATFVALADDRFFRPSLGDLRSGKNDRNLRGMEDTTRDKTETV